MTDPDIQRLRSKLHARLRTSRFIPETKARTGKLSSTTSVAPDPKVYDVSGNVIPNKIWVRIGATRSDIAGRSTVPVWNYDRVATDRADIAVILVEDASGDLYVDRADTAAAAVSGIPGGFYGDTGARPPELSTTTIPLANVFDLMPYRDSAGVLRARPGWLPNDVYWHDDALADTLDVTAYVTASTGMRAYVVVGINLDTNTWIADTTEDRGILLAPGSYDDIEPVLAGWTNAFPVCAIPMAHGATDFAQADIIDLRTWGSGGWLDVEYASDGVSNPPTQEELADIFGSPSDVGTRFLGILDDAGAGTKEYVIVSDGAQFLGVPMVAFRSELATATWARQGAVIEPLGTSDTLNAEPCVLYDTDPVILTDLPRVFKMWFRAGTGTTASGFAIYYAESPSGLPGTWVRYGSALVTSCFSPFVLKHSGVYHLYVAGGLYARIDLYTSTDGVNFTLHTSSVIASGSGWESSNVANPFAWVEGSTWYMLYEAQGSAWKIGLATSSDGISWTKSGSNPVISATGMRGGPHVFKSGSTYYVFGQGATSGVLPTDIYRNQSTDLTTWSGETLFLARSGADEGAAISVGQVADPSIVIVNGVAYFFYAATPDGNDDDGTIKLMTGAPSLLTA